MPARGFSPQQARVFRDRVAWCVRVHGANERGREFGKSIEFFSRVRKDQIQFGECSAYQYRILGAQGLLRHVFLPCQQLTAIYSEGR